jgi:hypothetical protein
MAGRIKRAAKNLFLSLIRYTAVNFASSSTPKRLPSVHAMAAISAAAFLKENTCCTAPKSR